MASEADVDEVAWFQQKGLTVSIDETDNVWWASLTNISNPDSIVPHYGRGSSAGAASLRARERWEQEHSD